MGLLHLALNHALQVSPASSIHLKRTNPVLRCGWIASRLERRVCVEAAPDLAFGFGSEALPQVQSAFLAQAAAGRAINEPPPVFVTLGENG